MYIAVTILTLLVYLSTLFSVCLYCSKGGSGSLGSSDSNGQQELQMAENLIYYSREEGKKQVWHSMNLQSFAINYVSQHLVYIFFHFSYTAPKVYFHNVQRVSKKRDTWHHLHCKFVKDFLLLYEGYSVI